jgi:hypothetical protein
MGESLQSARFLWKTFERIVAQVQPLQLGQPAERVRQNSEMVAAQHEFY